MVGIDLQFILAGTMQQNLDGYRALKVLISQLPSLSKAKRLHKFRLYYPIGSNIRFVIQFHSSA